MSTLNRIPFSASVGGHGRMVKIAATANPGTIVHTAVGSTAEGDGDLIFLELFNSHTILVVVTFEIGGGNSPDDLIKVSVPAGSHQHVFSGLFLRGGLILRAFASSANMVVVSGNVLRNS